MQDVERSVVAITVRSLKPSLMRAFSSVLSAFSMPLLLLAAISAAKMLTALGLMQPQGWFLTVIDWQTRVVDYVSGALATIKLVIPHYIFDFALFYIFVGNAFARAEKDELLAVELDEGTSRETFREAIKAKRVELFFYSIPPLIRGLAVRILWPIAGFYRLGTPWVVDGPGPSGDDISSSVPRREILEFAKMVAEAGTWHAQTVYDHRQVLLFQIGIGIGSSVALQALAKML